jgi:hypothetical protein
MAVLSNPGSLVDLLNAQQRSEYETIKKAWALGGQSESCWEDRIPMCPQNFDVVASYLASWSPNEAEPRSTLQNGGYEAVALAHHELAEISAYAERGILAHEVSTRAACAPPDQQQAVLDKYRWAHLHGLVAEHLYLQRLAGFRGHEFSWQELVVGNPWYRLRGTAFHDDAALKLLGGQRTRLRVLGADVEVGPRQRISVSRDRSANRFDELFAFFSDLGFTISSIDDYKKGR